MLILNEFSGSYSKRTRYNCKTADVTLAIASDFNSAGEILTFTSAKPRIYQMSIYDYLEEPEIEVEEFCKKFRTCFSDTVHLAGNGAKTLYKLWGAKYQNKADRLVYSILKKATETITITKVYSGGQTGIDEAGVKAALRLDIPVEVNMPNRYKIRDCMGKDVFLTHEETLERFGI